MSDYYPSPDELRDAWINDYDAGIPECSSTSVEANELEGQMRVRMEYECVFISNWPFDANCYQCGRSREEHNDDRTEATCEWFDSLPKPPEPLPFWMQPVQKQLTDRHPFA